MIAANNHYRDFIEQTKREVKEKGNNKLTLESSLLRFTIIPSRIVTWCYF